MVRGLVLAILVLLMPAPASVQTLNVLHIKVVVTDGNGQSMPVPRYRLQISDNPASALPKRVITSLEGTVDVRLAPGNYTVESERALTLGGKSYQWAVTVSISLGRDAAVELNAANAEIGAPEDTPDTADPTLEADPSTILGRWQDAVVAIWTATKHGSGFLINTNGIIAADQQVIGTETSVEVQISPAMKVAGTVIGTDAMKGVALIRIAPSIAETTKTLPLECAQQAEELKVGQLLTALEAPLARRRGTRVGAIESVLPNFIDTDLVSSVSGSGGPVFAPTGRLIGLTTLVPEADDRPSSRARIVRIKRVCEFVDAVAEKLTAMAPPSAALLPVESTKPFPQDSVTLGPKPTSASPSLYQVASDDFEVRFVTPPRLIASRTSPPSSASGPPGLAQLLADYGNWTEYVDSTPPVLLLRVTPKFAESFWMKMARGVAMTQGVSIPSIKRPKGDFARMRVLCGDAEIVPLHPFKLEHKITDKDTLVEGLYAFDPGALSPDCKAVTLQLFSANAPREPDTVIVDPRVIQQAWQDFVEYRR